MTDHTRDLPEDELREFFALSGRGLRHLHDGEYESAISIYEQLNRIMFFPTNYLFLARAYASTGRVCDALRTLEAVLEREPQLEEVSQELSGITGDL